MTVQEEHDISEMLKCLDVLDDRRRIVIVQRFGLDGGGIRTLKKVGMFLGITTERVRVLQYTALWKMKREAKKRLATEEVKV